MRSSTMSIQSILVVDDDALSRDFLFEAVSSLGYTPLAASSGEEALEILASAKPDLVLSDLRMPGMDGVELVRRMKSAAPAVPSLLITAHGTIEMAVQAMKEGVRDVLLKPCSKQTLRLAIERLENANESPEAELAAEAARIVAASPAMAATLQAVARIAQSKGTVLITGESGTGKERIAELVHRSSPRSGRPFVAVNCAALPESLLESEWFGHERGAFTGAHRSKEGRFELANGGTLLLDEIGEIPLPLQAKLLRVLEEEQFERVGGTRTVQVDVRVIATTNRDLVAETRAGRFREDLFYRLHVLPVEIAPLRERTEDIAPLARHFAEHFAAEQGRPVPEFSAEAMQRLLAWRWPGNVRELENVVRRTIVLLSGDRIEPADIVFSGALSHACAPSAPVTIAPVLANRKLEEIERESILATLESARGNKAEAARRLGVTPRTLSNKMKLWRKSGLVA
ncbi:MAG: sigma-54-dependent transcriptional regulator [Planctomycetota bacterium]